MKKVMMHIGVVLLVENEVKTDVLMNYALNSLNMDEQNSGMIRHVEVRGVELPSIEEVVDDNNLNLISRPGNARH